MLVAKSVHFGQYWMPWGLLFPPYGTGEYPMVSGQPFLLVWGRRGSWDVIRVRAISPAVYNSLNQREHGLSRSIENFSLKFYLDFVKVNS